MLEKGITRIFNFPCSSSNMISKLSLRDSKEFHTTIQVIDCVPMPPITESARRNYIKSEKHSEQH